MMELLAMFGPQNSLQCPKVDVTMCLLVEAEEIPPQDCTPHLFVHFTFGYSYF